MWTVDFSVTYALNKECG